MRSVNDLRCHCEEAGVQVDIPPMQTERLPAPHTGERDEVEQRGQAVSGNVVEEAPEFVRCPDRGVVPGLLGQLDVQRWVPRDEPAFDGGVERRAEDCVDVANHGSGGRVGLGEQVAAELVDVVGPEL